MDQDAQKKKKNLPKNTAQNSLLPLNSEDTLERVVNMKVCPVVDYLGIYLLTFFRFSR